MNKLATFTAYSVACSEGIPVVMQRQFFFGRMAILMQKLGRFQCFDEIFPKWSESKVSKTNPTKRQKGEWSEGRLGTHSLV